MPAKHTLHVSLTEPLLEFVSLQVAAGRHATVSSVVRAALELLVERAGISKTPSEMSEQGRTVRHG
ncbi:MAG: ribbon-helix-helix domain-containing protein [Janthinobacterium lividum]